MCVEMTGDDTLDILVTTFEGDMILFNGQTFGAIWNANFPGYETYRYIPHSVKPEAFLQSDILNVLTAT